jgi:hypothetical protein
VATNSREGDSKSLTLVTSATVGSTEKVAAIEMRPGMVRLGVGSRNGTLLEGNLKANKSLEHVTRNERKANIEFGSCTSLRNDVRLMERVLSK